MLYGLEIMLICLGREGLEREAEKGMNTGDELEEKVGWNSDIAQNAY